MTEIGLHLERLGLEQYHDAFVAEGFDTWETVLDIQESDLDQLGVKLGHRRKLQRAIAEYRGIASDRPLGSPSQEPSTEVSRSGDVFQQGVGLRESTQLAAPEPKRKYRRHPKADENAPEKPPSAYVLFSNKVREEVKGENLSFTEIARLVGDRWQKLESNHKEPFETQAAALKETYNAQLAEYKKTNEYKEYLQYLTEFKAKHGQTGESKRPKLELQSTSSFSTSGEAESTLSAPVHRRGGSLSSLSSISQGGPPSASAGPPNLPVAPALSSSGLATVPGRHAASLAITGSPAAYSVQDRRAPGHLSSHSSISEDSTLNRVDQLDPLSRAATLSLSTPPAATPPLPSSTSTSARSDSGGGLEGTAWTQRHPQSVGYNPIAQTFSSHLGTTHVSETWRDRTGDSGRSILQHTLPQPQIPSSSVPISSLLGSERQPELGQQHPQRILPPLPQPSGMPNIQTSGVPPFVDPRHGSPTHPPDLPLSARGQKRSPFNRTESEAANTLAELAARPAEHDSSRPTEYRQS